MIDVMEVKCPFCNRRFDVDTYVGEVALAPDACLTKTTRQMISWKELAGEIGRGYGREILSIGDRIDFGLWGGESVSVRVAAHDLYAPNTVIFVFDDAYWSEPMLREGASIGRWAHSYMAGYMNRLLATFPPELNEAIKPRTITQKLKNREGDLEDYTCTSKLWLPSRTEVFGEDDDYMNCDFGDIQFPFYRTARNRVKGNSAGDTAFWWVRSLYYSYSSCFCYVYTGGDANNYDADNSYGVSPAFII